MLLAIDSSTSNIGIALFDGNSVIGENTWTSSNRHTVILAPAVRTLLNMLEVDADRLKGIGIALGPGSFTSLRVGLSFAKGMALGLNIPLIGVPTLDILAAAQPKTLQPLCTVLQAGRGRLAAKFYRCVKDKWTDASEISVFSEEELADAIQEPTMVSGELTAELRTFLRRRNAIFDWRRLPCA